MFAIRSRRKSISEKDFLDAVQKVGALSPTAKLCCCRVALSLSPPLTTLRSCGNALTGHQELQEVLVNAQVHGVQLVAVPVCSPASMY
jgi:hypothetical protein